MCRLSGTGAAAPKYLKVLDRQVNEMELQIQIWPSLQGQGLLQSLYAFLGRASPSATQCTVQFNDVVELVLADANGIQLC